MYNLAGYVEINSTELAEACELCLKVREKYIDDQHEKMIKARMNKRFFPSKTREDAINYLQNNEDSTFMPSWYDPMSMDAYWYDKVEQLQSAAKRNKTVLVSSEMARWMEKYFKESK